MTGSLFIDTNVLVYAYDRSEPDKQQQARVALKQLAITRSGVISSQILAEFFNTVTRKIPAPLSTREGYERIENFVQTWHVVDVNAVTVLEAIRGVNEYPFSFWDAQVWASAKLHQIPVVLSEDFNTGALIEGVRFVNPFSTEFDLAAWV